MPCDVLTSPGKLVKWIHRRLGNPLKSRATQSRTHSGAGFVKAKGVWHDSPLCGNQAQSSFHYGFCALCPRSMRYVGGGHGDHPATRASQSRKRGRIPRARWFRESGVVRCDGMAPYGSNHQGTERNRCCDTVRLCFAPAITTGRLT